jgi:plasmid stabilization system protein ParE
VANESVDRADALRAEIDAATDHIAAMPHIGHTRPDLTERPVLFWTVHHYHIIYRPDTDPPRILRILSGYQDLHRILR